MTGNPIDGFTVDRDAITCLGRDLQRPECVLAERDGSLWSADARGGVMHIRPDGVQALITQSAATDFAAAASDEQRFTTGTLPNGLAFARNGDLVVSNFGTDRLELMTRRGDTRVLVDRIDGQRIGKVNFVLRDSRDRYWITVLTRTPNWMSAVRPDVADGFVALYDPSDGDIRVVADGFRFTNEIRFDAEERWLYVVETGGTCITRLKGGTGWLAHQSRDVRTGRSRRPDRRHRIRCLRQFVGNPCHERSGVCAHARGRTADLLDDAPVDASRRLMDAFYQGRATPELMLACSGTIAPWMASLTFFGKDLRQVAIGLLERHELADLHSAGSGTSNGSLERSLRLITTDRSAVVIPRPQHVGTTVAALLPLFNDVVGQRHQRRGHLETDGLGGLEVDHERIACRLLKRDIGRPRAVEYPGHEIGGAFDDCFGSAPYDIRPPSRTN